MSQPLREKYGPWALVTGASDGIGRAVVAELAAQGFSVVLVARRQPLLDPVASELSRIQGVQARVIAADLSDPKQIEGVLKQVSALDIGLLVSAAGFGTSGAFVDIPLEDEVSMLEVNCRASLHLTHVFAKKFVQRGRGGIVLLSSLVAFQGVPRAANYAATKAYVQSLGEGLHRELKGRGVDVLLAAPGPVQSGFGARARMQMGKAENPETVARGILRALGQQTTVRPGFLSKLLGYSLAPLGRWARTYILEKVMGNMTRHSLS
jgi:short-subunit dehydrogenase